MADDKIFSDEFVPNIQGANRTSYSQWKSQNPGEAAKWEKFRDDIIAGIDHIAPSMATKYGKALVAAGKLHMSVTDIGSVPAAPPPPGSNFYVTLAGNDSTGDGSQGNPWRTVRKACLTVPAGAASTINVGAGTFVETGVLAVPNNVSVVGAGIAATIIRTTLTALTDKLMTIAGGTGTTISDLRLDGQNRTTAGYGLYIRNSAFTTVTRINVTGFKQNADHTGSAVDFENVTDFVLSYSTLSLSGGQVPAAQWFNGCLGIGACTRALIDHCTVAGNGCYAVKAGTTLGTLDTLEISNCTFTCDLTTGSGTNITFELYFMVYVNCRLHHNNFDGVISLAAPDQNPQIGNPKTNGGVSRMRVDHNYWNIPSAMSGARYCIETSARSLEIDHNYINPGGLYPFGYFEDKQVGYDYIHHNIVDNTHTPRSFSNWVSSAGTPNITNIIIEKNTVVMRQAFTSVLLFQTGDATDEVNNNIFMGTVALGDILNAGPATVVNNGFYNITSHGSTPITAGNPNFSFLGGVGGYVPGNSAYSAIGALADGTFVVGPQ